MGATCGLADRLLWDSPVGWAYARLVSRSHAGLRWTPAYLDRVAMSLEQNLLADLSSGSGDQAEAPSGGIRTSSSSSWPRTSTIPPRRRRAARRPCDARSNF